EGEQRRACLAWLEGLQDQLGESIAYRKRQRSHERDERTPGARPGLRGRARPGGLLEKLLVEAQRPPRAALPHHEPFCEDRESDLRRRASADVETDRGPKRTDALDREPLRHQSLRDEHSLPARAQ